MLEDDRATAPSLRCGKGPRLYDVEGEADNGPLTGELVFYGRPEAREGIKYVTRGGPAKALMVEPPKNGLVITQAKDMDSVLAFWNDSKRLSEHRH
jgi:hypothetical protein